jgi:hypothetical protein
MDLQALQAFREATVNTAVVKILAATRESLQSGRWALAVPLSSFVGDCGSRENQKKIISAIKAELTERTKGQLSLEEEWTHGGGCSYCEPCGAGCVIEKLRVQVHF